MAAFAIAMFAASSASAALPEWGGCEATPPGRGTYTNSTCTVKATGETKKSEGDYAWNTGERFGWLHQRETGHGTEGLSRFHFGENGRITHNIGASTLELSSGKKMTCTAGFIFFRLENAHPKNVHNGFLSLTGCESEGQPCTSNFGENEGEVTNLDEWFEARGLKGHLGWIDKSKQEVGLFITAFNTKSENIEERHLLFAACKAGGPESVRNLEIGGDKKGGNGVIGMITPVNTMTTEYQLAYDQEKGIQAPSAFEGKTGGLQGNEEGIFQPLGWGAPPILLRPEESYLAEFWKVQAPIEIKTEA
jgi:hypothetical protein